MSLAHDCRVERRPAEHVAQHRLEVLQGFGRVVGIERRLIPPFAEPFTGSEPLVVAMCLTSIGIEPEVLGLKLKAGRKQSVHWPESVQSAGASP